MYRFSRVQTIYLKNKINETKGLERIEPDCEVGFQFFDMHYISYNRKSSLV